VTPSRPDRLPKWPQTQVQLDPRSVGTHHDAERIAHSVERGGHARHEVLHAGRGRCCLRRRCLPAGGMLPLSLCLAHLEQPRFDLAALAAPLGTAPERSKLLLGGRGMCRVTGRAAWRAATRRQARRGWAKGARAMAA